MPPYKIEMVKKNYSKTPESSTSDSGFANKENIEYSQKEGIVIIVFNKIRGCMKNKAIVGMCWFSVCSRVKKLKYIERWFYLSSYSLYSGIPE